MTYLTRNRSYHNQHILEGPIKPIISHWVPLNLGHYSGSYYTKRTVQGPLTKSTLYIQVPTRPRSGTMHWDFITPGTLLLEFQIFGRSFNF